MLDLVLECNKLEADRAIEIHEQIEITTFALPPSNPRAELAKIAHRLSRLQLGTCRATPA